MLKLGGARGLNREHAPETDAVEAASSDHISFDRATDRPDGGRLLLHSLQ